MHRNIHNKIHSVISPLFRIKNADTETGWNVQILRSVWIISAEIRYLLILSILTFESARSIRFVYQHFLSGITEKSLNVFYYVCSYAKVDYSRFMNTTVRITLKLIPDSVADAACISVRGWIRWYLNLADKNGTIISCKSIWHRTAWE